MTAGYSGTPLPKKLGIGPGTRVLMLGDPLDFDVARLRPPIDTAVIDTIVNDAVAGGSYDVVLLFCPDFATLAALFATAKAAHTVPGALWICWLKKSSRITTDLDENAVREFGLTNGRVDVKVGAVDQKWSGLKFVIRLADR